MADLVSIFLAVNIYAFFVASFTKMLKDKHGLKIGFAISNGIIVSAFVLLVLFVFQFGNP